MTSLTLKTASSQDKPKQSPYSIKSCCMPYIHTVCLISYNSLTDIISKQMHRVMPSQQGTHGERYNSSRSTTGGLQFVFRRQNYE